ncbi:sensor histidine kinase [Sulfurovum lithotrophicum]|nr:sensor histidine kinase [Sulfurovum lithotrophicum]
MYKYFPYKTMNHHEILLYGFHFSFLFIFILAVIRDLLFGNYFNASINFSALVTTAFSYYLLHFWSKKELASYLIIAIAVIPLYILIYFNHFGNMVIIYVILLPLATFFLIPFKKALIINGFIYILLIGILYYLSIAQPETPIINNPLALINIAFVSMLTVFFGIFYHLAIESTLSSLIYSNSQKDILLCEVHHRVKNNLNVAASMLGLQALQESSELQPHILKSKSRIEAIATVHEMLYRQESFDKVRFYDYVLRLEKLLGKAYKHDNTYQFNLNVDRDLALPLDTMVQLGLILNEMITNSLKYAKNPQGLQIDISMTQTSEGYLFNYKDNGIEYLDTDQMTQQKGLGMRLIELSTQQIEGRLEIYYMNGLSYIIRMEDA